MLPRFILLLGAVALQSAAAASTLGNLQVAHLASEARSLRADPKEAKKEEKKGEKAAGGKKMDLMKPMKLKAAEQGVEGKAVKHTDGKTGTSDWQDEYGHDAGKSSAPPAPKKSASAR